MGQAGDMDCVYAEVKLPYLDPAACSDRPEIRRHEDWGNAEIPDRAGAGIPFHKMHMKQTPVSMLDGRRLEAAGEVFDIDVQGFAFKKMKTVVTDWEDPRNVSREYFSEIEQLVRSAVPGAEDPQVKVLVFDHALRTGGKDLGEALKKNSEAGWGAYANTVHSDSTIRSMHTRAKDQVLGTNEVEARYGEFPPHWGEVRPTQEWRERLFRAETSEHEFPEGRGGEHLIVNVWRPLRTVENWPLCVLDGRTLAPGDVHPTGLQYTSAAAFGGAPPGVDGDFREVRGLDGRPRAVRVNETLMPLHAPEHRWVFFPKQQPDEALLFKIYDSRRDGRHRATLHTAFKDPTTPVAHRQSIEARVLVVFPAGGTTGVQTSRL